MKLKQKKNKKEKTKPSYFGIKKEIIEEPIIQKINEDENQDMKEEKKEIDTVLMEEHITEKILDPTLRKEVIEETEDKSEVKEQKGNDNSETKEQNKDVISEVEEQEEDDIKEVIEERSDTIQSRQVELRIRIFWKIQIRFFDWIDSDPVFMQRKYSYDFDSFYLGQQQKIV